MAYGLDGLIPPAALAELWRFKNLPDAIKLTAEQEASLSKLLEDFQKTNQTDLNALAKALDDARKAIEDHKPNSDVLALLRQAMTIQQRLRTAVAKLKTDMEAVLTPQQKAWLASGSPARCYPTVVAPLNADQRTAVKALRDAYNAATATARAAVAAALEAAAKARQQGKTAAEIKAIIDPVRPAMTRLQEAGQKLREDIWKVLTPAQQSSGCFGPAPKTGT
ncbi:MAG: hypothetical protein FIB01_12740 [Gemmatimonadetes bacterium]|nr:hypothetical protein [Gemmatimonadota bacterium]